MSTFWKALENWLHVQKKNRLMRRIALVLSCVVIFTTTYALILPAITMDLDGAEEVEGLFLEDAGDKSVLEKAGEANEGTFYNNSGDLVETDSEELLLDLEEAELGGFEETWAEGEPESVPEEETEPEAVNESAPEKETEPEQVYESSSEEESTSEQANESEPEEEPTVEVEEAETSTEDSNESEMETESVEEETVNPEEEATVAEEETENAAEESTTSEEETESQEEIQLPEEENEMILPGGGISEVESGNVVIRTVSGTYLPMNASAYVYKIDKEQSNAIALLLAAEENGEIVAADLYAGPYSWRSLNEENAFEEEIVLDDEEFFIERESFVEEKISIEEDGYIENGLMTKTDDQDSGRNTQAEESGRVFGKTAYMIFDIGLVDVNENAYPDGFQVTLQLPEAFSGRNLKLYHIHDEQVEELPLKIYKKTLADGTEQVSSVCFVTHSFSEFVLQYTVDFYWEVNGKTYEFSIPGGGFVSLEHLVEALGIATTEENTAISSADTANAAYEVININDIEVSEATKTFVEGVADVECSNPELVWAGKVDETSTVGEMKEANALEVQYSAELTEEQKGEINSITVEAGDWALISLQPFTSEESLTITMKSGDRFEVKITDGQIKKTFIDAKGDTWEIIVTYDEDAQIPENAQLVVTEIVEPELYDEYMQRAAEAVENTTGENGLLSGHFFDIQIKHGEEIIEPKAPVNVTIRYAEDVSLGKEDSMSAIHFAEDGIDLIEVTPKKMEKGGAEVTFEQDSFSVTGTIITSGVISNGNYCILYKNGNNYYALSNDGSAVQVTVSEDGTVKPVSGEDLPTNLIWTRNGQVWRGNQNTGGYLSPSYNGVIGNSKTNVIITSSDDSSGNEVYKFYQYSGYRYYLRVSNGRFTGGTSDSNNQFYLARIESNTNVKIHYGYLDDNGSYVEWTDRLETLRNPNMLGDQYDVRVEIDGYEYVTTRLSSSRGHDIIHLLQTEQDKQDGGNTPIPTDNDKTAEWRFREATQNNAIYPTWSGIAYDYRLSDNLLGNKDIYVIYRKDKKNPETPGGEGSDDLDAPHIAKEKQDNGDGTYDIDLSVTTSSESSSYSGRANVVIVLDTSGSMNESASSGGTKWNLVTSSIKNLTNELLGLNTDSGADARRVEFALVNFSNYVKNENWIYSVGANNKNEHIYTDAGVFNGIIDGLQVQGGTCWDKALAAANSVLWDDNDPVYVVFVSDGDTNSRAYAYGNYDLWDGGTYVDNTYSTDYVNNANAKLNVDSSIYFADKIREKGGIVYTVGITGGGNLVNLYRLTHGTAASHPYHYDVTDSAGINEAFTSIKNNILSSLGYQNVGVTDKLTDMTQTALVDGTAGNFTYTVAQYTTVNDKLTELPEGAALGMKKDSSGNIVSYTRNTGADSDTFPYIRTVKTKVSGSEATVVKSSNGKLTITFPDGSQDIVNQANYAEGSKTVTWNMGDGYQLRDDYTYTVTFTVWPNQASYDLLASLRNGLLKWGQDFAYTDETGNHTIPFDEYRTQIVQSGDDYTLRSNVESGNTVTYYKTSTETLTSLPAGVSLGTTIDDETGVITSYTRNTNGTYTKTVKTPGSLDFTNPEPMPLAGSMMAMTKVWNDMLDPSHLEKLIADAEAEGKTYSITLVVYQDGEEYKRYTFQPVKKYFTNETMTIEAEEGVTTEYYKYIWPSQEVSIAPALLVSDPPEGYLEKGYKTVKLNGTTYYVLNEGHVYRIEETDTDFHFEFTADPYHPTLIDSASVLTNVNFVTDEDGYIQDGSTAIISGNGELESFKANNSLTAELDITKKVVDQTGKMTQAEMDAETFTYKVTLTLPADADTTHLYAYEFVPRNDAWNGSTRVYAYGYQNEEDALLKGLDDDVARFNDQVFGRFTVSYPGAPSTLANIFTVDEGEETKTGTLFITLKQNEIIRFTNLPLNTQYTIQEIYANLRQADPSRDADAEPSANEEASNLEEQGYEVSVMWKNGAPTVSSTAVSNDTISGTIRKLDTRYYNQFTNTRTQLTDGVRAELKVKKVVEGYDWESEYYNMKLTAGKAIYADNQIPSSGTAPMPSTNSVNIYDETEDHTLSFGNVQFTRTGTYTYTITEYDNSANMPYVLFADPIEVTITVSSDENGRLQVESVSDNSGIEDNSIVVSAAADGSSLGSVITTMTNRSRAINLEKVDSVTGKRVEGAVFELRSGRERLYFDSSMRILTEAQVLDQIGETSINSETAIAKMKNLGITSSFTMGQKSLRGFSFTGYTLSDGEFVEDAPTVYQLVETSAPSGYVITAESNYFKVVGIRDETETNRVRYTGMEIRLTDKNGNDIVDESGEKKLVYKNATVIEQSLQITITNEPGVALPSTGGSGTDLFYLFGTLLTGLAGTGLVMKRRRRNVA